MIINKILFKLFSLGDPKWGKSSTNGERNGTGKSNGDDDGDKRDRPSQGGRGESDPPDLEEVWRDFNRKLGTLFGNSNKSRGNGGWNKGGGRSPIGGGPIKVNGRFIGGGIIGLVFLWLGSGFYIVEEGQTALVLRFGEYKYSANAGFNWRVPYPVDSHEIVNFAQLRQTTVGVRSNQAQTSGRDSLMLTTDENIVDVQFAVQYRIGDPEAYVFNNLRPDDIVRQGAETAMREVVGRSKADAVLYENKEAISREALDITQKIADRYSSGITIVNLTIQNVQPPEEVQAAFSDAIKAAQDAEKTKNEGQAYANDVIPRARGSAFRLIEEAQGYQERVIATAEGDSDRFNKLVSEYKNAPVVTRERLYLEAMQEVFSNVSKVMVENKSGSNLLYLPLDKLVRERNSVGVNNSGNNGLSGQSGGTQGQNSGANNQNIGSAVRNIVGNDGRGGGLNLRERLRDVR